MASSYLHDRGMAHELAPRPVWQAMADAGLRRWAEMLDNIADILPAGGNSVVVDGDDGHCLVVADRLAATLHAVGRPCSRLSDAGPYAEEDAWHADRMAHTVALADGPRWRANRRWDVVIWLRTPRDDHAHRGRDADGEAGADIVIDLHDPAWPVIRHVAASLASRGRWYISETRAFFGPRAATWDTKFGDDLPAYAAAIIEADVPEGGVVIDVGCGTGRALPALRQAVGRRGAVIALDLTTEMLLQARAQGRGAHAALVVADARHLPLADVSVDAVFAAGLIMHLPDTDAGLRELAQVTRPGGLLVLFHPSGRAAVAARHGRTLSPDEPLAEGPLRQSMRDTGWRLTTYKDMTHRFLAIGERR
jgi:ubiquinone/menaquinone biosynthesis C-methylase UbiE